MKKDGYSENTLETFGRRLRYLAKYVNLGSPERVKEFIAEKAWSNGYARARKSLSDFVQRHVSHHDEFPKLVMWKQETKVQKKPKSGVGSLFQIFFILATALCGLAV